MSIYDVIFYAFMVIAVASAIGMLFTKNLFKAALFLLISLLSVAAIFLFAFAEFVAVVQVLIYAGGVIILIIFGIMLTSRSSNAALQVENNHIVSGLLAAVALLVLFIQFLSQQFDLVEPSPVIGNSVSKTGVALMSQYALPFELAGILLLAALIGAAVTSTAHDKSKI